MSDKMKQVVIAFGDDFDVVITNVSFSEEPDETGQYAVNAEYGLVERDKSIAIEIPENIKEEVSEIVTNFTNGIISELESMTKESVID